MEIRKLLYSIATLSLTTLTSFSALAETTSSVVKLAPAPAAAHFPFIEKQDPIILPQSAKEALILNVNTELEAGMEFNAQAPSKVWLVNQLSDQSLYYNAKTSSTQFDLEIPAEFLNSEAKESKLVNTIYFCSKGDSAVCYIKSLEFPIKYSAQVDELTRKITGKASKN